jgi:transcriptional regulator with XRE-family HTH domain
MSKLDLSAQYERLRELLIAARKDRGFRQQELAEGIGRPQSFVAKYEGGARRLDVVEFIQVAQALGVDPKRIIRQLEKTTR